MTALPYGGKVYAIALAVRLAPFWFRVTVIFPTRELYGKIVKLKTVP